MMKKLILSLLAALAFAAPAAFANGLFSNDTVILSQPLTQADGWGNYVLFEMSANSSTPAGCVATGYRAWIAVDVSTASGAFVAAVLQSARLSGQAVYAVYGTGNCINSVETAGSVQF